MTALSIRYGAVPPPLPLDMLLSAIPSLPRAALDRLTARMIDRLDEMDGDLDLELNGDELDGTGGEDDFLMHGADSFGLPGNPEDAEDDDPGEDEARDDGCGPINLRGRIVWGAAEDEPH